jgi:hypothetical protein
MSLGIQLQLKEKNVGKYARKCDGTFSERKERFGRDSNGLFTLELS